MKRNCPLRDEILVAYALAVNHQNEVASQLEHVSSENERQALSQALLFAARNSQELRAHLVKHCSLHRC